MLQFTRLVIFIVLVAGMAFAQGTYRAAFRTGCTTGSLFTTCGHRLDATVMQPLAAIKWTADEVQPLLAESWDVEQEGKAYVFHLRQGVTWHDDEPFTADDVVFTYNTYANPQVGSAWNSKLSDVLGYAAFQDGAADSLEGVTKIDDATVRIELNAPNPNWVELFQTFIVVLPEHILGDVEPSALAGHPYWENRVGTGPFKWSRYEPDQFIEVVRNEDYFLGAPRLERIIYQIYADIPTILNALENGEVDSMSYEGGGIPLTEVERFMNNDQLVTLPQLDAGLPTYLQLDLTKEQFADPRIRQAMMYAIDRQAIVSSLLMDLPRLAHTLFPQDWTHPDDLETYAYDPERARTLLQEAGWDSSTTVDFIYYYNDQVSADVIATIQQFLADVGITIAPRFADPATIQTLYSDGTFEMGYFAQGMGLDPSLGSTVYQCGAQLSFGYCSDEADNLAAQGVSVAEREARAPFYQDISRILNQDVPKVWLWNEARPLAFNKRVVGLSEHWQEQPIILFNVPVYNEIETWYVEE